MVPIALTIAGSDPSGGAGIQADLKTFHQLKVYGAAVVTLVTVQNTQRVSRVEVLGADLVGEQIDAVLEDLPPAAVKTGALGSAAVIEAVARRKYVGALVVDPVMVSSHGRALLDADGCGALIKLLLPRAALITPNLDEASILAGMTVASVDDMRAVASKIASLGAASVLVKGGHLAGDTVDVLFHAGAWREFGGTRIDSRHTHGTGCTYSAAITAFLARGYELPTAVEHARRFVREGIASAPGLGSGTGPLNHWASV